MPDRGRALGRPRSVQRAGKAAFDEHIVDPYSAEPPDITITRLTEENNVVVAEGAVRAPRRDGTILTLEYCDVFEMRDGKIARLVSYLMTTPSPEDAP